MTSRECTQTARGLPDVSLLNSTTRFDFFFSKKLWSFVKIYMEVCHSLEFFIYIGESKHEGSAGRISPNGVVDAPPPVK